MRKTAALILSCMLLLTACGQSGEAWQEQYDLGVRYLSEGNYEEAVVAFTAAIEIDPKRPEAYIGRGDACWELGRADNAREDYAAALALDKECTPEVYGRLAELLLAQGDREESLELLRRGLEVWGGEAALLEKAAELGFRREEDGSLSDPLADMDPELYYLHVTNELFGGRLPQTSTDPELFYLLSDGEKEAAYRPLVREIESFYAAEAADGGWRGDRWLELLEGIHYILGDMDQVLTVREELCQRKLAADDQYAYRYSPEGYTESGDGSRRVYDGWGRYVAFETDVEGAGSSSYEYDAAGRPVRCTTTFGGNPLTVVDEYSYDGEGRLSRRTCTTDSPDGVSLSIWTYSYEGGTVTRHCQFVDKDGKVTREILSSVQIDLYGYRTGDWQVESDQYYD